MKKALVYLCSCFLWGSSWSVIAIGLRDLPPLCFAGARMLVAGLLLAPLALRGGARLSSRAVLGLSALGVLQIALPYGLMFIGQQWTPTGLAAVLFATFPIWVALHGRIVLKEPLTLARILAAALGVMGVAVLEAPHLGATSNALAPSDHLTLGSVLIVAASAAAALANVIQKRYASHWTPLLLTSVQTASSGLLLLAASALFERAHPVHFTPRAIGAVLYLAIFATAITYVGFYWLLTRVPLAVVGTVPLLDTAFAATLGVTLLHERVGWSFAVGGALVLGAAGLANLAGGAGWRSAHRRP